MSSLKNNNTLYTSFNFFTADNTPHNQVYVPTSFTQIENDPVYFIASQIKRQIIKSAQKTKGLRQLNSRSFRKRKVQSADTDFSLSLPQNKSTLENYNSDKSTNKDKSKLFKTIQDQRKLLNKVTIHRIRSQRQNFQNQTKKLQNSYNYLLHQVQKSKKKSEEKAQKLQRIKHIQQQSKKQKLFIQTQKTLFIKQNLTQKSRLRQTVLSQKKHKQKKIIDFCNGIQENASRIRFQSSKIEQEILKSQKVQIQQKKSKYLTEKQSEKNRLLNREKKLQNKMVMAQNQFKLKWLKEFNESSQARKKYMKKRQVLNKKMQKLCEEMSIQNTIQFNEVTRNKSEIKMKSLLNPED